MVLWRNPQYTDRVRAYNCCIYILNYYFIINLIIIERKILLITLIEDKFTHIYSYPFEKHSEFNILVIFNLHFILLFDWIFAERLAINRKRQLFWPDGMNLAPLLRHSRDRVWAISLHLLQVALFYGVLFDSLPEILVPSFLVRRLRIETNLIWALWCVPTFLILVELVRCVWIEGCSGNLMIVSLVGLLR